MQLYGFENFLPGQQAVVQRVLGLQVTLLNLSTGSGKSLCYQVCVCM